MLSDKIKELNETKSRVAALEQAIATDLATLPARYGFDNPDAFIAAFRAASNTQPTRRRGRPAKATTTPKSAKRRKRAKITDETRAEVKKLVEAGKTGNEIAQTVGISLPSVANIKKSLGMSRPRGKRK